jgi:hypothetical protein
LVSHPKPKQLWDIKTNIFLFNETAESCTKEGESPVIYSKKIEKRRHSEFQMRSTHAGLVTRSFGYSPDWLFASQQVTKRASDQSGDQTRGGFAS